MPSPAAHRPGTLLAPVMSVGHTPSALWMPRPVAAPLTCVPRDCPGRLRLRTRRRSGGPPAGATVRRSAFGATGRPVRGRPAGRPLSPVAAREGRHLDRLTMSRRCVRLNAHSVSSMPPPDAPCVSAPAGFPHAFPLVRSCPRAFPSIVEWKSYELLAGDDRASTVCHGVAIGSQPLDREPRGLERSRRRRTASWPSPRPRRSPRSRARSPMAPTTLPLSIRSSVSIVRSTSWTVALPPACRAARGGGGAVRVLEAPIGHVVPAGLRVLELQLEPVGVVEVLARDRDLRGHVGTCRHRPPRRRR